MSEWLKEPVLKTGMLAKVSGVRILPHPSDSLVICFTPCYLFSVKYTSIFSKKKYKQKGFTTVSCLFKIFFLREQVRYNGLLKSWSVFSSFKKRLLLSMRIQVGIFSMRIQVVRWFLHNLVWIRKTKETRRLLKIFFVL